MKQIELAHINDREWIKNRELQWQRVLTYEQSSEVASKKEQDVFKRYFFTGDFSDFVEKSERISLSDALNYYPAINLEQVKFITNVAWEHDNNLGGDDDFSWVLTYISFQNQSFSNFPKHLHVQIFEWLYGAVYNEGSIEVDLDLESWRPEVLPDPKDLARKFTPVYCRYFFESEGKENYSDFDRLINYYLSVLPYQDPQYNVIQLANPKKSRISRKLFYSQIVFRKLLLSLLGYRAEDEVQNFPELQAHFANILFNELKMPKSFYKLVDYLHEHKRDALIRPKRK